MNRHSSLIIGITLCLCAIFGVAIEGFCIFYKIPDMNMPVGQSFTHVLDTIVGGLIGAFVGARPNVTLPDNSNINLNQPEVKP